jgi:hypothetical protein
MNMPPRARESLNVCFVAGNRSTYTGKHYVCRDHDIVCALADLTLRVPICVTLKPASTTCSQSALPWPRHARMARNPRLSQEAT